MLSSLQNASSFSQSCLCIQLSLQSPPKIHSSTSLNFRLPITSLILNKIILTSPTNTFFLYTAAIFHFSIFTYNHFGDLHLKLFLYLSHLANSGCVKEPKSLESCEEWHYFNLSLLPQSIESDKRAHKHLFLIINSQKIAALHVVVSNVDVCDGNGKPSNPLFLIYSSYCHILKLLSYPQTIPY